MLVNLLRRAASTASGTDDAVDRRPRGVEGLKMAAWARRRRNVGDVVEGDVALVIRERVALGQRFVASATASTSTAISR